jgi:hypothetical protein
MSSQFLRAGAVQIEVPGMLIGAGDVILREKRHRQRSYVIKMGADSAPIVVSDL